MNAALFNHKHQTLYPVGQSDQAIINSMKLGSAPLRAFARRSSNRVPVAAPAPRREYKTWATPVYAATA